MSGIGDNGTRRRAAAELAAALGLEGAMGLDRTARVPVDAAEVQRLARVLKRRLDGSAPRRTGDARGPEAPLAAREATVGVTAASADTAALRPEAEHPFVGAVIIAGMDTAAACALLRRLPGPVARRLVAPGIDVAALAPEARARIERALALAASGQAALTDRRA